MSVEEPDDLERRRQETGLGDRVGPRLLALHLPQFHPIPENDAAWGPGFTEWTNVAAARPLYPGHAQPKLPGELGFYDLRLSETRAAQAELARDHGIEGFCYWHYWFAGRRVLERPVNEIVASGEPDLPFCLGWANHSWTGVWCGAPDRVIVEQTYPGSDDYRAHFESVLPTLRDPRYMTVDGAPIFVVFQPLHLPDAAAFTAEWRKLARDAGLPGLHLVGFGTSKFDPAPHGFDANVRRPRLPKRRLWHRLLGLPAIGSYRAFVRRGQRGSPASNAYPIALSNWDNTPRAGRRGRVLYGSTPELFAAHLREAIGRVQDRPPERQLVFLKSWNEWAEGNYLEPDRRSGRGYLEVIRDEVQRARAANKALDATRSRPR